MNEKITEGTICNALNAKYSGNAKYKLANIFAFGRWESDFFLQKENGYSYEFEVKISRSDFFHDKKKTEKHSILERGKYDSKSYTYSRALNPETGKFDREETITEREHTFRPNKFFYVVPENMVSVEEIPSYAGLMYYSPLGIITIKEAPFIHKEKLCFAKALCHKFYHYWLCAKSELRSQANKINYAKELLERNNIKHHL